MNQTLSNFDYSRAPPPMVWGYPSGVTLLDTVPEDMRATIHPHWTKFPPVNPFWHYILGFAYIIIGSASLTGNGLVIYLFTKTKELKTPANMFVVNLAFSDLCMMISQFPMYAWNCFNGGTWLFGPFACELYAATASVTGLCSILTMTAISYDRYNVIVRGMNGPRMTSGKATGIIAFCWCYATFFSVGPFFGWGKYIPEGILDTCSFDYLTRDSTTVSYTCTLFATNYCTPLSIICFSYFHIVRAIINHEKELRDQAAKMNVASLRSNVNANETSAEIRIAKIALMNVSLWVCMWTPYAVTVLTGAVGDQNKLTPLVCQLPGLICKCASVANPIVFAISHPKYRLALQKTIPWFCINEKEPPSDNKSTGSSGTTVTENA